MSPFDDDRDVTSSRDLDDRAADGLLRGRAVPGEPELSAFVGELLALADGPAPAPSAALAAMLEGGLAADTRVLPVAVPVGTKAVSWRVRGWALPLQLTLAGAGCLALVLGAAAAGGLPAPAQTAVANVIEAVTPLHVPRPAKPAQPGQPVPAGSPSPTSGADPADSPLPRPSRSGAVSRSGSDSREDEPDDRSTPQPSAGRGADDGEHAGRSGDDGRRPSAAPADREPSDKSGDGDSGGDRRKSGGEDDSPGKGSGSSSGSSSGSGAGEDSPVEPDDAGADWGKDVSTGVDHLTGTED